jgi:hypothetical protein
MTLSLSTIETLPVIGQGNFRVVMRQGPTVYKVEYDEGIDLCSNQTEVDNLDRLRAISMHPRIKLPDAYLYVTEGVPVVAMEYIDGTLMGDCFCLPREGHDPDACLPDDIVKYLVSLGIDTSYGNVIKSGKDYYLIDLDADLR